jgi:azurin
MLRQIVVASGLLLAADMAQATKTCTLTIEGNDLMRYNVSEMTVAADCTEVEVVLKHVGKLPVQTMGHNWVLAATADFTAVANAGVTAGLANDHVPPGDARVIAHTRMIGGGQTAAVRFSTEDLTQGGDYTFFCSFPGHYGLMKGKFIVQ